MKLRLAEHIRNLEMDWLSETLANQNFEITTRYLPYLLVSGKWKLHDIKYQSSTAPYELPSFRLKVTIVVESHDIPLGHKTISVTAPDTTLLYDFLYETTFRGKFHKNMEWYLSAKEDVKSHASRRIK